MLATLFLILSGVMFVSGIGIGVVWGKIPSSYLKKVDGTMLSKREALMGLSFLWLLFMAISVISFIAGH